MTSQLNKNHHVCTQTAEVYFIDVAYSYTLKTMHAHCLHWLISTGLFIQSTFWQLYEFTTDEMVPMVGSKLAVGTYIPIVGTCGHHSHSKLYHLCHLGSLFSLCYHPSYPCTLTTHSMHVYASPKLMNSLINHQKVTKVRPYLFAMLVTWTQMDKHSYAINKCD